MAGMVIADGEGAEEGGTRAAFSGGGDGASEGGWEERVPGKG